MRVTPINIEGLKSGDKKVYEAIYLEYFDMLFHLALGYIGEREASRCIVQDTFTILWERRETLNDGTNILNYLYTITKNNCLNYLRQEEIIARNTRDYLIPELRYRQEALQASGDSHSDLESLIKKIDEAVERLPQNIRATFKLNRFKNLTYSEIALKLDISPKTVEARISRALKILRKDLKEYLPIIQTVFGFLSLWLTDL